MSKSTAIAAAVPPAVADIDAERAMLSSVWLAGDAQMARELDAMDFLDPFHQWILWKFHEVLEAGEPLDMVAMQRRWRKVGGLDGLTEAEVELLPGAVADLLKSAPTTAHVRYYFVVLRTERLRRAVLKLADVMRDRLVNQRHEPAATLAWAGEQIDRLLTKVPVAPERHEAKAPVDVPEWLK